MEELMINKHINYKINDFEKIKHLLEEIIIVKLISQKKYNY